MNSTLIRCFVCLLVIVSLSSCVTTPKKQDRVQKEVFYPKPFPNEPRYAKIKVNKKQEWQKLYDLYSTSQFAEKKTGFWAGLDVVLGEKREADPFIARPSGIAVIKGSSYIVDTVGNCIWQFDFSSKKNKLNRFAQYEHAEAFDIAFDEQSGNFFVSHPKRRQISVLDKNMQKVRLINCLFVPLSLKVRGDKIYVVDHGHSDYPSAESLFVLDKQTGKVLDALGMPDDILQEFLKEGDRQVFKSKKKQIMIQRTNALKKDQSAMRNGDVYFSQPSDVDIDEEGNVYVSEDLGGRILKFDSDLNFLEQFGRPASNLDCFDHVLSVAVDKDKRVYGVDTAVVMTARGRNTECLKRSHIKVFSEIEQPKEDLQLNVFPYSIWGGEVEGRLPNMTTPSNITIDYKNVEYFQEFASPNFKLEYLVWVSSKGGALERFRGRPIIHGKVVIFGFGKLK